jgi:malate/lactate dehydrogenase
LTSLQARIDDHDRTRNGGAEIVNLLADRLSASVRTGCRQSRGGYLRDKKRGSCQRAAYPMAREYGGSVDITYVGVPVAVLDRSGCLAGRRDQN